MRKQVVAATAEQPIVAIAALEFIILAATIKQIIADIAIQRPSRVSPENVSLPYT